MFIEKTTLYHNLNTIRIILRASKCSNIDQLTYTGYMAKQVWCARRFRHIRFNSIRMT